MDGAERDSTQDWLVPAEAAPPLLGELELKVDEAVAIARASADAVDVVGEAALDAAQQARRAAELAENASEIALEASRAAGARARPSANGPEPAAHAGPSDDLALARFVERAERVAARFRAV
jgi:hypothetical protein